MSCIRPQKKKNLLVWVVVTCPLEWPVKLPSTFWDSKLSHVHIYASWPSYLTTQPCLVLMTSNALQNPLKNPFNPSLVHSPNLNAPFRTTSTSPSPHKSVTKTTQWLHYQISPDFRSSRRRFHRQSNPQAPPTLCSSAAQVRKTSHCRWTAMVFRT